MMTHSPPVEADRIRLTLAQVVSVCTVILLVAGAYYTSISKDDVQDRQLAAITKAVETYSKDSSNIQMLLRQSQDSRDAISNLNTNIHQLNVTLEKILTTENIVFSETKELKQRVASVEKEVTALKVAAELEKD